MATSQKDLRSFPKDARSIAGHEIDRLEQRLNPNRSKSMPTVGAGVSEIIVTTDDAFRVFYVAKFEEAVYVLHAFQKKTEQTAQRDIERGRKIYRELVESRKKNRKK